MRILTPGRTLFQMTAIYTKKGDAGETGLANGQRVPKNHVRMEAAGTLDEANVAVGLLKAAMADVGLRATLERIQSELFSLGASMGNPAHEFARPDDGDIKELELMIDEMTAQMPSLTHFILPGGSHAASLAHMARTIVRRAERRVVTVSQHQEVSPVALRYLNRLSDYFFTLARFINYRAGIADTQWSADEV